LAGGGAGRGGCGSLSAAKGLLNGFFFDTAET